MTLARPTTLFLLPWHLDLHAQSICLLLGSVAVRGGVSTRAAASIVVGRAIAIAVIVRAI